MKIRIESNSLSQRAMSGVGYYTKLLIESLAKTKDTSVRVFTFNFLDRQPAPHVPKVVDKEINRFFPLKVYAKLQSHRFALPFDLFLKRVDLTIFPNYARWPSIKSKLTATVIHDLTYIKHPELIEKNNLPHLRRVVPRSIKNSDFIITVSETVKQELVDQFDISPKSIVTTPIPPAAEFYSDNPAEIHKKYSIPTKKYILFLGTIEPRKNIPELVAAYRQLPAHLQKNYSLVIAGGAGWKSEESLRAINTAAADGLKIIKTGYIDEQDKSALYQKASLFVMPSLYEGFGMPILEAAASKIPVVATDIPVLVEAGGKGAVYFKLGKKGQLAEKIELLLTDSKLRRRTLAAAKEHLGTFSWETNSSRIISKVEELLKNQ